MKQKLKKSSKIGLLIGVCLAFSSFYSSSQELKKGTIDRKSLVQRHNLKLTAINDPGPSQVGNGEFAYGFDITGMQTLRANFATMASWGWHSTIPPIDPASFKKTEKETNGRMVPYELANPEQAELSQWLEQNPHKFNLGRIGLWRKKADGGEIDTADIEEAVQYFDLWSGTAESSFKIDGQPVKVFTVGDPEKDIVAFRVESPLIQQGELGVFIEFPYASLQYFSAGSDFEAVEKHTTALVSAGKNLAVFNRKLDNTTYQVACSWTGNGDFSKERAHKYSLSPYASSDVAEYVFSFAPSEIKYKLPTFAAVKGNSAGYWPSFWKSGGAVNLSKSTDKRWFELERRIVLSQYLMKINASGKYPPQETGLVSNSWYGRFHYEMIWWNQAHFALWNRWPLLRESLKVYEDNLESAIERAKMQGYQGARYAKCTGPDGREWPHPIHAFLVWQQPHPIFFADLDYRAHPTQETLKKWDRIVEHSADFLASYAQLDRAQNRYDLGTPISFVPENNDYYKDKNPSFELAYWRYGLKTAQQLRKKLGKADKPLWNNVYNNLAPLPINNGFYEQWENVEDMWSKFNFEHPALLGAFGMLPGYGVDTMVMERTYQQVQSTWKYNTCWGWDFPLVAMTAARLGHPADAVDMLLHDSPKNSFDAHAMVGGGNPYPYIPTNGALLYAVAMMCAGWDGSSQLDNPGFPANGSWIVEWEDLKKAP